jgi:translation initiation factor IF-2
VTKKRVYDLAKEIGMKGQDLAVMLRDWGFEVKSHMTALEDSDLLVIQGRLQANGYGGAAAPAAAEETTISGVIVRKKKKKPEGEGDAPAANGDADVDSPSTVAPSAAAPTSAPSLAPAPAAEAPIRPSIQRPTLAPRTEESAPRSDAPRATPRVAEPIPSPSQAHAPAAAAATPSPVTSPAVAAHAPVAAPKVGPAAPVNTPVSTPVSTPAATPAPAQPAHDVVVPVRTRRPDAEAAPVEKREPTAAAPSEKVRETPPVVAESPAVAAVDPTVKKEGAASAAPEAAAPGAAAAAPTDDVVRASDKRRAGKVVGFIDLSKVQPKEQARRESRRLQSRDDAAAPEVQPTLGKGRRPLVRGTDQARGNLTASELREREGQRFLRRARPMGPGQAGPGGPGRPGVGGRPGMRGRSGGRMSGPGASPLSGSEVLVEAPVTVKRLADVLAVKQNEVLRKAFDLLGFGAVNINSVLDEDTSMLLAEEFGVALVVTHEVAAEEALLGELRETRGAVADENLTVRTPTVAILGHVDHGKTTLIDALRKSRIADGESGGITQHIGAYRVFTKAGHPVTVVDTPGHAAFTAMRARGARAVDIVIVVIAADDGVMPQTEEAINHARVAKTPIVVALNKMDKPEANPERVKQQLAGLDLVPEEWGGTTAIMPISALTGDGIDALLERVFLEGELLELRAHDDGSASGVVLEAEIQQGRGIIAYLLVQDGSLERGNVILAGEGYGRVRSMHNDRGDEIEKAGPSMPVEVTGLDKLPGIGEYFHVVPDLQRAKEVAEERERSNRMSSLAERRSINRDNLFAAVADQARKTINLIVKADVQGSVEVLRSQLQDMRHEEVEVRVLHAGVGAVTESDVDLAITSDALVVAFHVSTNPKARQAAERGNVTIKNYRVIYEILDDVRKLMEGTLRPDIVEEITGHAEIRVIFRSSKIGNIGGSHVIDGKIYRDSRVRLIRDGKVVFTGYMGSLRREKDDSKEVREGFDCGIVVRDYNDIQEGDVVESYRLKEVKRTL